MDEGVRVLESSVETTAPAEAADNPQARSAARWLYVVSGLGLVNAVLILSESPIMMIFGLSSALVAVLMFYRAGLLLAALLCGLVGGVGFLVGKGKAWAFVAAIALYLLDAAVAAWAVFAVGDTSFQLDLLAHAFVMFILLRALLATARSSAPSNAG